MNVEIKGEQIVITLDLVKRVSKSGKSIVVATTGGNQPSTAQVDGQTVVVGCNCYIKRA